MAESWDVVCVGGGVVGLLVAHDLAERGLRVAVVDRRQFGQEASWAGAGIVPPARRETSHSPYERLRAVSFERFPELDRELREEVGIDVGFRQTGGLEVARDAAEVELLHLCRAERTRLGIETHELDRSRIAALEPHLTATTADWVPSLCQVRNPRFLAALVRRLEQMSVALKPNAEVRSAERAGAKIASLSLADGSVFRADHVVIAAGAWSGELLARLGEAPLPVHPMQGQIVALQTPGDDVRHIVLEGKRYLVPRDDGLVLIGATEELVGFDKQVTVEARDELVSFGASLFPPLADRPVKFWWAGLRPACGLGHPILGPHTSADNLWLATGHFRHGVQQSPGTARLLADWITGQESFARAEDFSPTVPAEQFHTPFPS